jgi:hypothetical protein
MALSFLKKAQGQSGAPAAAAQTATPATAAKSSTSPKISKPGSVAAWMKTGKAAQHAIEQADAKAEAAKAEAGKMFRFWMPADDERKVTFLDGTLDADGLLDIPMWDEHRVKIAGDWENFACTANTEPCPVCNAGDSRATLVGALTVIDHSPYTIKSGPNAGKVVKNSRKLFVCTRQTIKLLNKQAAKRGGLKGCTFEISRTGDKEPGVGNQFEFVEKHEDMAAFAAGLGLKLEEVQPADYANEITYRTADELLKLGIGKAFKAGVGAEKGVKTALKDEL